MIIKVLVCHPDHVFVDFISSYLILSGFDVKSTTDCVDGFTQMVHFKPQLVIANKDFKGIDAKGLLIKKNATKLTEKIPVFLIGNFSSQEIVELKKLNARAFISTPVNPVILVERMFNLFDIPLPSVKKTMPMLMDIHARGNIIVAQIEGNFEPEKLEIFNYYIRSFCTGKSIKSPRVLLIIPSLYPETITQENVDLFFKFTAFPELKIQDHYIKILTGIPRLISLLKMNIEYAKYEIVPDFLSAFQILQIDFDKKKTVPVEFIKKGSIYIFDLYDNIGKRVIPALALSVDYDGLINALLSGYGSRAPSIVPLGILGVDPKMTKGRDLAQAKALLKEAGYEGGFTVDLSYGSNPTRETIAAKLKNDLAEAGITVNLRPLEQSVYLSEMRAQKLAFCFGGWTPDYLDPTMWTDYFSYADRGIAKRMLYNSPEAEKYAKIVGSALDLATREQAIKDLQKVLMDEVPFTMLYQNQSIVVMNKGVQGFAYHPVHFVSFYDMSK